MSFELNSYGKTVEQTVNSSNTVENSRNIGVLGGKYRIVKQFYHQHLCLHIEHIKLKLFSVLNFTELMYIFRAMFYNVN